MGDAELELLRRALFENGLTLTVNAKAVCGLTLGRAYMAYRGSRPRGRAWQMERNLLRPFVVAFWRRPASSLGPADWEKHRAARRRQKTRLGRPPCELTLNLELAAAKRLLPSLKACKAMRTRTRRESWFTSEQVQQLIDAADCLRWEHQRRTFRALATVMGDTGLRISGALSLRWDRMTLRGTSSVLLKGGGMGVVAFTPRALQAMGDLDRHPNPHVFTNWRTGKLWNASTIRAWFRAAVKAAGLEDVKADGDFALVLHTLRHSAASIADERGAPATWIQAMLHHRSLRTTQHYLHRSEADAAIRMAAIMSGRKPPRRSASGFSRHTKKEIASATGKSLRSFS